MFENIVVFSFVGMVAIGMFAYWRYSKRPPKPLNDEQLLQYYKFLIKHVAKKNQETKDGQESKRKSRAFQKVTTASLEDDAYDEIRKLFTPQQLAEYNERILAIKNEISARACAAELSRRRGQNNQSVTLESLEIIEREGLYAGPPIEEGA